MKKPDRTVLIKRTCLFIIKGSTRGCRVRFVIRGETASGEYVRVETNPCSASNTECDLHNRNPLFMRLAIREKRMATPVADWWETSCSSGKDLEAEFDGQKRIVDREQNHG